LPSGCVVTIRSASLPGAKGGKRAGDLGENGENLGRFGYNEASRRGATNTPPALTKTSLLRRERHGFGRFYRQPCAGNRTGQGLVTRQRVCAAADLQGVRATVLRPACPHASRRREILLRRMYRKGDRFALSQPASREELRGVRGVVRRPPKPRGPEDLFEEMRGSEALPRAARQANREEASRYTAGESRSAEEMPNVWPILRVLDGEVLHGSVPQRGRLRPQQPLVET
jgi:hypothetical protein